MILWWDRRWPKVSGRTIIKRGGMGAVYRGKHLMMDKTVAIKVLRPSWLETMWWWLVSHAKPRPLLAFLIRTLSVSLIFGEAKTESYSW